MKLVFACWLLLLTMAQAQTLRLNWKPEDFQPLTELPWKDTELHEVAKIVERIFREPNPEIRYPVLAEYLRQVPMLHFAAAFDVAVVLEGAQVPDAVVSLMLRVWAERDPQEAWERTQELVRLVGFEDHWLSYESWKGRPKIQVQDLAAIRASRYWLTRNALLTYPLGVEASKAPEAERVRLMKAFADLWFEKFKSWPDTPARQFANDGELMKMFQAASYEGMRRGDVNGHGIMLPAAFEAGLRRWIVERPLEGPAIVKCIRHQHWDTDAVRSIVAHDAPISAEFLETWCQASPSTLEAWAGSEESKDAKEAKAAWLAKCIMMPKVDKVRREEWLSGTKPEDLRNHLAVLAPRNPELAMELAVRAQDGDLIEQVATDAVYGFGHRTLNRTHAGLGFIKSFDIQKLQEDQRVRAWEWGIAVMEQWGAVDIGEAARYGFRFLTLPCWTKEWPGRENLLRFFSGEHEFADDGMIDRTFCALRVWAVIRPEEMREWIRKQDGADMRKALTWLLEHPWGEGEEKEAKE